MASSHRARLACAPLRGKLQGRYVKVAAASDAFKAQDAVTQPAASLESVSEFATRAKAPGRG